MMVKTGQYLELEARGEVALAQYGNQSRKAKVTGAATDGNLGRPTDKPREGRQGLKAEVMELRDRSIRAGWSSRRIDRKLREMDKASWAVKAALLRAWRGELEG